MIENPIFARDLEPLLTWMPANATFYGGADGSGTMAGSCGYGNSFSHGYGLLTTAVAPLLYDGGSECGSCWEIMCQSSTFCRKPSKSVVVTVTNLCPGGDWCKKNNRHFDLSKFSFNQIANEVAGVVPVSIRRVNCKRSGNITFTLNGNPSYLSVLISNVGGPGNLGNVQIKANNGPWLKMSRSWGAVWSISGSGFFGKALSFKLQSYFPSNSLTLNSAVPKTWAFGGTYSNGQFSPATVKFSASTKNYKGRKNFRL